jgi:MraZ protein
VFRGNHPAKVDDKGRLKVPSEFKTLLDAANVTQFYITSIDGKSAQVWPLPEWERQERQLAEFSTLDDAVEKYLNLTSYYGQQVEMDSQARVVLPQILRGTAKLDAEVTVFGKLNYLEVRNREIFEQNLPAYALTAEERQSVAAKARRTG